MYEIIADFGYGDGYEQIESEITTRSEARELAKEYYVAMLCADVRVRYQRPTRFYVKPSSGSCFEPGEVSGLVATIGKNVRKARQFGWTNQPAVCTFSGYHGDARFVSRMLHDCGFLNVVLEKDWR